MTSWHGNASNIRLLALCVWNLLGYEIYKHIIHFTTTKNKEENLGQSIMNILEEIGRVLTALHFINNNICSVTTKMTIGQEYPLQWRHNERNDVSNHQRLCSTVCSGAYQGKCQRSALLAFVRGIHRWPVDSPHKGPVTRKMFPFDNVILVLLSLDGQKAKYLQSIKTM